MCARIKANGIARRTWSEWQSPDDVDVDSIPERPGVYMVRAVDTDGSPAELVWPPGDQAPSHAPASMGTDCDGVLYIGLAGRVKGKDGRPSMNTLRKRFGGDLLRSWRMTAALPAAGWPHGSRTHYDKQGLVQYYPLDRIQVRYKVLLPSAWLQRLKPIVQELVDLFGWDRANEHVEYQEAAEMRDFKRIFGRIPLLNVVDETTKLNTPVR